MNANDLGNSINVNGTNTVSATGGNTNASGTNDPNLTGGGTSNVNATNAVNATGSATNANATNAVTATGGTTNANAINAAKATGGNANAGGTNAPNVTGGGNANTNGTNAATATGSATNANATNVANATGGNANPPTPNTNATNPLNTTRQEQVNLGGGRPKHRDQSNPTESISAKDLLGLTYWILGGAAVLLAVSGGLYISEDALSLDNKLRKELAILCASAENTDGTQLMGFCSKYNQEVSRNQRKEAAKSVFEFMKTFLPPIVTLVLGVYYVDKRQSSTPPNS